MRISRTILGLTAALAMAGFTTSASAATFLTSGGQADITQSGNILSVVLTSLNVNPISDGSELSGIQIEFSAGPATAVFSGHSYALINIASGGVVTSGSEVSSHWGTLLSGNSLNVATVGPGAAGGQPYDLIIDGGGVYTNANPSITGKNPQVKGSGTFSITLPTGFTADITGVKFQFGTEPGYGGLITTGVPEPATWAMFLVGFGAIGFAMRSARKSQALTAA